MDLISQIIIDIKAILAVLTQLQENTGRERTHNGTLLLGTIFRRVRQSAKEIMPPAVIYL